MAIVSQSSIDVDKYTILYRETITFQAASAFEFNFEVFREPQLSTFLAHF
jgi:hypothetical protein